MATVEDFGGLVRDRRVSSVAVHKIAFLVQFVRPFHLPFFHFGGLVDVFAGTDNGARAVVRECV